MRRKPAEVERKSESKQDSKFQTVLRKKTQQAEQQIYSCSLCYRLLRVPGVTGRDPNPSQGPRQSERGTCSLVLFQKTARVKTAVTGGAR